MSYDVPFGGRMAGQSRPLIPSGEHHGGKGTEEKGDIQGRGEFFCRLAIGGKRRRNDALAVGALLFYVGRVRYLWFQYMFAIHVFQHGHLLDGDLVEFMQAFLLGHAFIDKNRVEVLHIA